MQDYVSISGVPLTAFSQPVLIKQRLAAQSINSILESAAQPLTTLFVNQRFVAYSIRTSNTNQSAACRSQHCHIGTELLTAHWSISGLPLTTSTQAVLTNQRFAAHNIDTRSTNESAASRSQHPHSGSAACRSQPSDSTTAILFKTFAFSQLQWQ